MPKYFKNSRDTHVPFDLDETRLTEEEWNEYMEDIKEVGETLRQIREEKGWTQKQLAEKVGIEEEHIEMMETGKQPIPIATAKRFGEVFQKDHEVFLWR